MLVLSIDTIFSYYSLYYHVMRFKKSSIPFVQSLTHPNFEHPLYLVARTGSNSLETACGLGLTHLQGSMWISSGCFQLSRVHRS